MEYLCLQCHSILLLLLGLSLVLRPPAAADANIMAVTDFMYGFCNVINVSSDESFVRNFNSVANSLIHNSSRFLYASASSDQTGSESSHVHGMYQCRGDISLSDCSSCVTNGLAQLSNTSTLCGQLSAGAVVGYRGCTLRYENFVFFSEGEVEKDIRQNLPRCMAGSGNESSALYQQNVRTALQNSASAASTSKDGYGNSSVGSGSDTSYALSQCMGYLNPSQCATCLSQLLSNFSSACNRSVSGQVYLGTACYLLFSNTSLLLTYNNSPPSTHSGNALSPLQAPTIATHSSSSSPGINKYHTPTNIVGVANLGVFLLLAIL